MRSRTGAGVAAGTVAGIAMAMFMMAWMAFQGEILWTNPNLIAAMWLGPGALGGLTWATALGFTTHQATSALMGWIAVPFIRDLPTGRTLLVSFAYALASYPLVFALILTWANPMMVTETSLVPMTLGHALFGLVMGAVYLRLAPR